MAMTREQADEVVATFAQGGTQAEVREGPEGVVVDAYITIEPTTFDSYERAIAFARQDIASPTDES